jgi:hypothetical protein
MAFAQPLIPYGFAGLPCVARRQGHDILWLLTQSAVCDSNLVSGVKGMATKVYVNNQHEATIVCEQCGKWRNKNVSSFINTNRPLKIKCNCEHIFHILLEVRSFYRKATRLNGVYAKVGERQDEDILIIEDI